MKGYPILDKYKYLGIEIDDCLKLNLHKEQLKKITNNFKRALYTNRSKALPIIMKFHAWNTLVYPKIAYGTFLLGDFSKGIKEQVSSFLYQSFKMLLNIKGNPSKVKLNEVMLGMPADDFFKAEAEI